MTKFRNEKNLSNFAQIGKILALMELIKSYCLHQKKKKEYRHT